MEAITSFQGPHRFLSNFYPSIVHLATVRCATVEHAYQAAKTQNWDDALHIIRTPTPGAAKRAGRRVVMRDDWESIKCEVMRGLLREKFTHPDLAQMLLGTGASYLEEGNTWGDSYWGTCRGKGRNVLGCILMDIRQEVRNALHT